MSEQQKDKYFTAAERYFNAFGWPPHIDGLSSEDEMSDDFIDKLNLAVKNNDPDIDLSDYFPSGRNL